MANTEEASLNYSEIMNALIGQRMGTVEKAASYLGISVADANAILSTGKVGGRARRSLSRLVSSLDLQKRDAAEASEGQIPEQSAYMLDEEQEDEGALGKSEGNGEASAKGEAAGPNDAIDGSISNAHRDTPGSPHLPEKQPGAYVEWLDESLESKAQSDQVPSTEGFEGFRGQILQEDRDGVDLVRVSNNEAVNDTPTVTADGHLIEEIAEFGAVDVYKAEVEKTQ